MASDKLPAIQFYPGDWRRDIGVQSLSYHDRGVWFEVLMLMHQSERRGVLVLNGRAMPDESIGRMLGLDNQSLTTTLTNLLTSGVASREPATDALMCRRMVRDEELRKTRKECGKLGGNPVLVNQKSTTGDKQIPTPSSSSSSSSSKTLKPNKAQAPFVLPEWVSPEVWNGFVEMRQKLRKSMTPKAKELTIKDLSKLRQEGNDPSAVLEQSIKNSWQGLYPVKQQGIINGNNGSYISTGNKALDRSANNRAAGKAAIESILGADLHGGSGSETGDTERGRVKALLP
jgi:hypothetical protein